MASSTAVLHLDNQLCFALYSASLAMTKVYTPLLTRLGVTYPQYLVLMVLWQHAGATVSELGARLCLDSGTLTPLLKRLAALGLVTRQRDAADERRVIVTLTSAGRALRRRALAVHANAALAAQCSARERRALILQLNELRSALSGHAHDARPN